MNDIDYINDMLYNIEEDEGDIYLMLEEYYISVNDWN